MGEVGNFFSNLLTGKGKNEVYFGVSVSLGNFEYSGNMFIDVENSNISIEFSNPTDELLNALQNSLGLPITINSEGVTTEIPLSKCYVANISIPVSCSSDGTKASLTFGIKGKFKEPISSKVNGSLSIGCKITVSVQDGPFGTIKNRKNASLNQKVYVYRYYSSIDFLEENLK